MKITTNILLFSFLIIAFTPFVYALHPSPVFSCGTEVTCCVMESAKTCTASDMERCPPGMCHPAQCVFCCFLCPVHNDVVNVRIFETDRLITSRSDQFLIAGYSSELFQPPEISNKSL